MRPPYMNKTDSPSLVFKNFRSERIDLLEVVTHVLLEISLPDENGP